MPNWAEQVTAIATAVGAIGLLSAIGAVVFAAQQAREARIGRQAAVAVEFFRRWDEDPLVEARRLVARFPTPEALRDAMTRFIAEDSVQAYVLYRELDFFEQLGALELHGGFDFELIKTLLGRRLIDRWELWQPSIDAMGGTSAYPMFYRLVTKLRAEYRPGSGAAPVAPTMTNAGGEPSAGESSGGESSEGEPSGSVAEGGRASAVDGHDGAGHE